ncbi:MAG: polysaccharide biosynthesis tyrosine autokinase [Anaerolineales bacterium]|nr:polysaccharide biosynthesis tyrosine autokinase [Anaerolineales bacterium]
MMVNRAMEQDSQNYYSFWNEVQLAGSYAQLINIPQVLKLLNDKLGYQVSSGQISVKQVENTLLLNLTVTDGDPQRAADIANSLVDVFSEYNESLQTDRYRASEETLQAQIAQVESQIASLQVEMSQITERTLETQRQQMEDRLMILEEQINEMEQQAFELESQLEVMHPTPEVTNTPAPSWHIPTSTPVPVPTPTLSAAAALEYRELRGQLERVAGLRDLYKQAYSSLLIGLDTTTDPMLRQDQLQTTLALYQQIYTNLLSSYENVRLSKLRDTPTIVLVEAAPVPSQPIQPQPMQNVLMGLIGGAFLMGVIAFAIEYLDDTLKTPEDVNHYLQLPVIGLIGRMDQPRQSDDNHHSNVFVADSPLMPMAEAFRTLRTNLDFAAVNRPLKTLLITSCTPSEGKTTLAVNLAAVMAQGGRKVILVDADLRRPSIHRFLGIANRKGLSDAFRNHTEISSVVTSWGDPAIAVISSGALPPNPAELLASDKMGTILSELSTKTDIVILDSPPAIVADPIALSAKVDGVLLVIEPGKTKIGSAQVLMEQMNRANARVVGVVLNSMSRRRSGYYYSKYHYYSSYYYSSRGYNHYTSNNGKQPKQKSPVKPEQEQEEVSYPAD